MTDTPSGSFTTRKRQLQDAGELSWGGDSTTENNKSWSDTIDSSSGITISDSGTIQTGVEKPSAGIHRWTFDTDTINQDEVTDIWASQVATISGATTGEMGANITYETNEAIEFGKMTQ